MRLKAYLWFLGWQGGTIHQVSDELDCDEGTLLSAIGSKHDMDYIRGLYANTNPLEHRLNVLLPQYKSNLQYWLGVARCYAIELERGNIND